jgi:peptidase E
MVTMMNVRKIIKDIGKDRPEIAYIGAASRKDNRLIYAVISALIKAGCKCRIQRVALAPRNTDLKKAQAALKNCDAVLISGGDVDAGMQVLREKNMVGFFQDLAKQGKLIIGMSAGSIMMSREWVRWRNPQDDSTAELFPCLGLVPFICDTHAEGDNWAELKMALQLEKPGVTGYGITSGAYLKAYPDGRLEAKVGNSARYTKVDGKVEQQPDLIPNK